MCKINEANEQRRETLKIKSHVQYKGQTERHTRLYVFLFLWLHCNSVCLCVPMRAQGG